MAIEKSENKMLGKDTIKNKAAEEREYFFPEHEITVKATSIEEAGEKLKAIINDKK